MAGCQKNAIEESTSSSLKAKQSDVCYVDQEALHNAPVLSARPIGKGRIKMHPPPNGNYSCIFLDFDGQTVTNPYWNNGNRIQCAALGLNSTQTEEVMDQVRYAYAAYNIVITSSEAEYNNANRYMHTRVIITPTNAWRPGVSGIAYNNSITWGDETPAFVFSNMLYNIEQYIGEIAAHEAGHTLSLNHQTEFDANCNLVNQYANGKIMGNSLYVPHGEWTIGTTYTCNTFQNDNQVLTNKLGLR